jgi:1,4-dihydroxy-2-naphthoate octaprenyltransferase
VTRGERFWDAHRSHFYQRATDNGLSVMQVVTTVFLLNLVLAGLALTTVTAASRSTDLAMLALGVLAVLAALFRFSRPPTASKDARKTQ